MKTRTTNRLLSLLLSLCMLLSILPISGMTAALGADTQTRDAGKDLLGLPDGASQIENYGGTDHPYGRAGWFNINPVSELAVFASKDDNNTMDNRYRNYSFARDKNGNVTGIKPQEIKVPKYYDADSKHLLSATDKASREYRFAQSVAFDPGASAGDGQGKGQNRYLATVAYSRDEERMYLIVAKADNTGVPLAKIDLSATGTNEDFGHIGESDGVWSHRYRGTFSIAAGDFNGDGADSIVVYRPIMAQKGQCTPVLTEYRFDPANNRISSVEGDLNLDLYGSNGMGPLYKSANADAPVMTAADFYSSNAEKRTYNTPIIQMTAEDTDRDGRDELVVAAGFANVTGDADYVPQLGSQLLIYERGDAENGWVRSCKQGLSPDGDTKSQGRLRYAGVSVGSLITESTGTDFPEIIAAGYVDNHTNSGHSIQKDVDAYIYRCNGVGDNFISSYGLVQKEDIGLNEMGKKFSNSDDNLDPVQVTAFAAKGAGQAEYVVIEGMVWGFEHDAQKQETKFKKVFTPFLFAEDEKTIGSLSMGHNNVQEAVAGNFDGNPDGREQVIGLAVYRQQGNSNHYYYKMVTLGLQEGTDESWQWTNNAGKTMCWFDTNPDDFELYQKGAGVVSLAAVDVDRFNDGTLGKIKSRVDNYSKPGVLAILEAAPFFKEADEDVRNGGTSYGKSLEEGGSSSTSNSVSANVLFGYEFESTGMGGGFEANFEHKSTWTTSKTTTTTFSTEYYNDSEENQVLVYRAPLSHYIYETILPDGTSGQMNIVVQGSFATNMVPIDTYNDAAAFYALDPIDEGMLGTPGKPDSYNRALPVTSTKAYQAKETSSYSSSGTIKQSVTHTTGQETSYEYSFGVSLQGYGLAGGVKFGGGAGYEHTKSNTKINTNAVTKEGAVSGRSKETPDTYNFNWRFATWDIRMNDSEVPVLGYLVTDVTSPPSPPINLGITDESETTLTLEWEHSSNQAVRYNIYRYFPDSQQRPYVKIGSVNGVEREFVVTGLSPATTYRYVIRAEGYVGGVLSESTSSDIAIGTTLDVGGVHPKITGPGDMTVALGGTAQFNVHVDLPSMYTHFEYVWQEKKPGGVWETLTTGNNDQWLTISPATAEHNNRQYRYVVTAFKKDGSYVNYYSRTATLNIGKNPPMIRLTLQDGKKPAGGRGTADDPYYISVANDMSLASDLYLQVLVPNVTDENCSIQFLNLDTGDSTTRSYEIKNGAADTVWQEKEPGVFALTAYYPGSATRLSGYSNTIYCRFVSLNAMPAYRLALFGSNYAPLPAVIEYGTVISGAKLFYRPEMGAAYGHIYLSPEEEYRSDNLIFADTYKESYASGDETIIEHPFGADRSRSYLPGKIGLHEISVLENGSRLASAAVQVTRRNVTLRPTWEGTLPPDKISDIGVEVVPGTSPMVEGDTLDTSWFTIQSSLYDANGNRRPEVEGNIAVSLILKNLPEAQQTDAFRKFLSHYRLITQSRNAIIEKDSYNINYAVAAGHQAYGTLEGRHGINKIRFDSGENITRGERLEFTARPVKGYTVDQWMNNGVPISSTDQSFFASEDGRLVAFSQVPLNITVSFKRTDDILLYFGSANPNWGSVSAVYNGGTSDVKVADGDIVPQGSQVTLTAHPGPDLMVEKWMIDGREYRWEDSGLPYHENTLTINNYNKTSTVIVHFKTADTYNLKILESFYNYQNSSPRNLISITDLDGRTLQPGPVAGGKQLTFESSMNDVKCSILEWRISTDGEKTFTKLPGSDFKQKIVLPTGISQDTTVQAVYVREAVTVAVAPPKVQVNPGNQQQFTASILGMPEWGTEPPQEVTWRIEGAQSAQTTISENGLLCVAQDETADRITVLAKSVWSPFSPEGRADVTTRDLEPPTGEITLEENGWTKFLNIVTFSLFFKQMQDITITAEDDSGEEAEIVYYLSERALSGKEALEIKDWKVYEGPFGIQPNQAVIVYAKLTDVYGNASIINSNGIVVYTDSQAVTTEITVRRDQVQNLFPIFFQLNGNTLHEIRDEKGTLMREGNEYNEYSGESSIVFSPGFFMSRPNGTHKLTVSYNPAGKPYVQAEGNAAPATTTFLVHIVDKNQHTLAFDTAGGTPIQTQIVTVGENPGAVADPVKEGYTFLGWYKGEDKVDLATFNMPKENITLTAKWREADVPPTTYTLTFDADGGEPVPAAQPLTAGATPMAVTDPVKEGHIFLGWYNDDNEKIDLSTFLMPGNNITLKAYWQENKYTLTIVDGTDMTGTGPYIAETRVSIQADATPKEGYVFDKWVLTSGDGIIADATTASTTFTMTTSDATVTATYKDITPPTGEVKVGTNNWKQYLNTITFGQFFKEPQEVAITAADNSGDTVGIEYFLSSDVLTLDEVKAKVEGWSSYTGKFSVNLDREFIVYTRLTDTAGNMAYLCSDGVVLDATSPVISGAEDGESYKMVLNITVTDKHLETVTVNGEVRPVENGSSAFALTENGTYNIYAKDKAGNETTAAVTIDIPPETYTLTFNADGGEPVPAAQPLTAGATPMAVTDPVKEGYTFLGWYNNDGEKVNLSTFEMPESNVTLTAKWEKEEKPPTKYTLTFDTDGGTPVPAAQTLTAGATPMAVTDPVKEGYTFLGWYNNDNEKIDLAEFKMPDTNVTLKAKWEKNETPTTKYVLTVENGTGDGRYKAGEQVFISTIVPEGKEFVKWEVKSGNGTLQDAQSEQTAFTMGEGDAVVAAVFKDSGITDPTNPSDPTNPTDPTDPSDPTNPTNPTDPSDPATPGNPSDIPRTGDAFPIWAFWMALLSLCGVGTALLAIGKQRAKNK